MHALGQREDDGGEVQNAIDASRNEPIGHGLGRTNRNGDDAQPDPQLACHVGQTVQTVDGPALDFLADFRGINVEGHHDLKALVLKPPVAQQCPAEIADPDDDDRPVAIGSQYPLDLLDQFFATVADTRITNLSEVGQVFADLCVGKAEPGAQMVRTDRVVPVTYQVLQLSQIIQLHVILGT